MDELTRKVKKRLLISAIALVILYSLSMVSLYYFHTTAPIVPIIFGAMASPAMAILLMSLHDLRSIRAKKSQPSP